MTTLKRMMLLSVLFVLALNLLSSSASAQNEPVYYEAGPYIVYGSGADPQTGIEEASRLMQEKANSLDIPPNHILVGPKVIHGYFLLPTVYVVRFKVGIWAYGPPFLNDMPWLWGDDVDFEIDAP